MFCIDNCLLNMNVCNILLISFKVKAVKGLSWGQAAIGNATWSGARLCDVLKDMGIKDGKTDALHIQVVYVSF